MTTLHDRAIVIDGLMISNWGQDLFRAMRSGGLTAVNCTTSLHSVWEGFPQSVRTLTAWKQWFRDHDDIILHVRNVEDIVLAKRQGKTGIIMGWQNSTGFGDYLPYVEIFHELGLRVVQITYHTANMAGGGCLERHDGGLSNFGHDVVSELNRVGMLIDLSHVGPKTSSDVIKASNKPVAYTHCAPMALKDHPRNKTDEQLSEIADQGGLVGVTMFPPFLRRGNDSTVEDYAEAIEHVLNICGEDQTAVGTDFTQGFSRADLEVLLLDKGYGRKLLELDGEIKMAAGFSRIEEFPNLTATLEKRGWPEKRIRKVLGENWMRIYQETWGA